ncbi:di-heme-cytochrome C peroxidase [Gynuella sunshinyii]|uniref:Cytochrome c domain-containing protein n=1 Tax=Gynuella sunshinyii YC6258 TaxID=1445510 RepID=A0A0C5V8U6_9GAMM|nr:di-heme-cytochrome C peroxidase [Gynuella sunshinyii]AJQ95765.1 hypothetical Protein YC6258_03729 [Gynuella sunshinyii YC6258]
MQHHVTFVRRILSFLFVHKRSLFYLLVTIITIHLLLLLGGKIYQHLDRDPDRGAIAIADGAFGESYSTPIYLEDDESTAVDESQGWSHSDSLWFYNITQGSALLPYDFYLSLESADSEEKLRSNRFIDYYRYLPQKKTFFNPDALAVGFVKDTYQGKDYMGFTCAACHTAQINYQGQAVRIDGGPAMADMVGYLTAIEKALHQTRSDPQKKARFMSAVLALSNDYKNQEAVEADLQKWTNTIQLYNTVNHSHIDYGYARLDAFGRIYNRVLQYVPNRQDVYELLTQATTPAGRYLISDEQANKVLEGINETIIGNDQFALIIQRLMSHEPGYPGLTQRQMLIVRNALFNEPDAPVSYPFLWDIARSDYVQWNGLAANSGIGPLGRNTGEVIGVFGILDWTAKDHGFSISAYLSGQRHKHKQVDFKHSIDLVNLKRIENHLGTLKSPLWPEALFGNIDVEKARAGQKLYARYCESCHQVIDRNNADRIAIAKMTSVNRINTDPAMADNSVSYRGKSGNFVNTFQAAGVGNVIIAEDAPVVQLLTSVTKGVVATPDPDKNIFRRWGDWLYTLVGSFFTNPIRTSSVKAGNYDPDTTANPYASLLSYKARPLNGIWATAPFLHNGSVPSLYDLMLPKKKAGDPEDGEYRPDEFMVGSREFDPVKVGFRSDGYDGTAMKTIRVGDLNSGHEYAAGHTPQPDGSLPPALTTEQRWQLLEYLKTL